MGSLDINSTDTITLAQCLKDLPAVTAVVMDGLQPFDLSNADYNRFRDELVKVARFMSDGTMARGATVLRQAKYIVGCGLAGDLGSKSLPIAFDGRGQPDQKLYSCDRFATFVLKLMGAASALVSWTDDDFDGRDSSEESRSGFKISRGFTILREACYQWQTRTTIDIVREPTRWSRRKRSSM